jgi:hypothetical protein
MDQHTQQLVPEKHNNKSYTMNIDLLLQIIVTTYAIVRCEIVHSKLKVDFFLPGMSTKVYNLKIS